MFSGTYIFAEKHIFFVRPLLEHGAYEVPCAHACARLSRLSFRALLTSGFTANTRSNRFERWQGNSDIIAFGFLFDAIICRIKIHFLVIMTSSDSVSISVISQDG